MAEITDKIKLPVRVEQHREAIGETGDYDYFWLLLDADGTQVAWWPDGDKEKGIAEQIRDSLNDPTPASTAPKEVIEKYALGMAKREINPNFPDVIEQYVKIYGDDLTRFASEIGVDADRLWCEIAKRTEQIVVKNQFGKDAPSSRHKVNYDDIVAALDALKAAGGGK